MALLGTFKHAPSERKLYTLDYSAWLQANETVTSFTWVVDPASPTPATIDASNINTPATSVSIYISGGVNGTLYRIFVTATTNLGQIKEDEIRINSVDPAEIVIGV